MEIILENYTKSLKKKTILDNINLKLKSGKVYGFQGINGSGKTMLMRAVLGLITADTGQVLIDGEPISRNAEFPKKCGFLIENPAFLDNYSAKDNLRLLASIKNEVGDEEIVRILQHVDLDPESKKVFKKFSLGMKQRLGVAAAFLEKPELIILDEPMNGLDTDGVKIVSDMIREFRAGGGLCILACHDREILYSLCDEIINIDRGKVTEQFVLPVE